MGGRFLIVFLCAVLALPAAAITPASPGNPLNQEFVTHSLAAKGKKKKGKPKPRIVRQTVTQTFRNLTPIAIPETGSASPYPAAIGVTGLTNGAITDVNVTLEGFSHATSRDVDILLAPAHLPNLDAILMSDVGGPSDVSNLTVTFDDQAASALSFSSPLASGTFRPSNDDAGGADGWPGQTPTGNVSLQVFNSANPNGSWQLFVVDDSGTDDGKIARGWPLPVTAEVDKAIAKKKKKKR